MRIKASILGDLINGADDGILQMVKGVCVMCVNIATINHAKPHQFLL